MGKILVTGATGTIGSQLVRRLKEKNLEVIAGVSSLSKAGRFSKQGIDTTILNFAQPDSLEPAFEGVDRLFLLLPLAEPMEDWGLRAIAGAQKAGVQFILRSSCLGADSPAEFELGQVHGRIDQALIDSGLAYTIVRPNSFMQNYLNFFGGMIKDQQSIFLPQGQGRISLIDVRDIAAVDTEILTAPENHRQKAYDLTGPEALTNEEIARILARVLGKPITSVDIDELTARQAMARRGMPEWNIRLLESLNRRIKLGMTAEVTNWVRMIAGRQPTTFEQFAWDHADAWK